MDARFISFRMLFCTALGICLLGLQACKSKDSGTLFRRVDHSVSGIDFVNRLNWSDSLSVLEFEYMFNGGGVALIDVNNDGLQDVFFSGNMVSSRLYLNKGDLRFEDITRKAGVLTKGWANGVSVVDINQDGLQDLYVCRGGTRTSRKEDMENLFFVNQGNNTFREMAAAMRLNDDGYGIQAAFFDFDRDGDLDMYLLRNAFVNYNRNTARPKDLSGKAPSTDKLFRNDGNLSFTDVSMTAGITAEGFGLGVSVCDLNNDDWPDLYVSNDFLTNDLVWINNQDGTFSNQAATLLKHMTYNGMGNDVADYNNDSLEDIFVVDMLPPDNKRWKLTMRGNTYEEFQNALTFGYEPQYVRNTLQLNNGNGSFSEIGVLAGVAATEWSWAPLFADYNNDGFKDVFVTNGYRQDITNLDFIRYGKNALFVGTPEANRRERLEQLKKFPGIKLHDYLFENKHDLTFDDVSEEWGMSEPNFSNGAAYGDLDNDGDLDLVVNNLDQEASLYENRATALHPERAWLRLSFRGAAGNKNGIGTKVWIWQKGRLQYGYVSPCRGYLSATEPFLHFGIANAPVDSIKVRWPDGRSQWLKNIKPAQLIWLDHAAAVVKADVPESGRAADSSLLFVPAERTGIVYHHKEDDFVDFKLQPLLPRMLSHEGPGLAAGDLNGDGLDDFLAGAAKGGSTTVFFQQRDGTFRQRQLDEVNAADNMGLLLFDAEGDGDLDIYVANGGVDLPAGKDQYRHFLYLNDGRGQFSKLQQGFPQITGSASSVAGADYDRDGDIDLFVGGRVSPGQYPFSPESFLLRNDSKKGMCRFTDASKLAGTDLSRIGMVTAAVWTDIDNDSWPDLIVVGEFMPVRIFKNHRGSFAEAKDNGLQHSSGWWNSIVAGDFDKDGDMDYVLGNLGLNASYKASVNEPVCIYASDYDKDGRLDPVMCHFIGGKEYTVHSRDDINRQMTPMRGRFRTYESYADVEFRDAFRRDEIEKAFVVKSERFESTYLENRGNGQFLMKALPLAAQFSPIYGMLCNDFDGDGNLDVLSVGNSYATEVQSGRYDAQGSLLLLGDGKGNFRTDRSRLNVDGDNKAVVQLMRANGTSLVVISSNSDSLKAFVVNRQAGLLRLENGDVYAQITDKENRKYKMEFYCGQSYLSQSGRNIPLPGNVKEVTIYSTAGTKKQLKFEK